MALKILLPLDTSVRNLGSSELGATLVSNGTFNSAGKLTATSWVPGQITIPYPYHTTGQISIALWVKPNSAVAWSDIFGWGNTSIANRIEITSAGGSEYRFYGSGNCLITSGTVLTTAFSNAVWHHFAMIADGSKVKFYLDGTNIKEVAQSKTLSESFGDTETIWIGKYNTRSVYSGYFNDFRVYDHALSAKEVHDLAQGLIIHYPMCNRYVTDSLNLLYGLAARGYAPNSTRCTYMALPLESGYRYMVNYTGTGSNAWSFIRSTNLYSSLFSANKTYTWSCKYRVHSCVNTTLYFRTSCWTNHYHEGVDSAVVAEPNMTGLGEWKTISISHTITQEEYSNANFAPLIEFYTDNMNTSGTVYEITIDVKETQIIESNGYLDWTASDMRTTRVPDCSGSSNDGKVSSVPPSLVTSKGRNDYAWKFNAGTYITYTVPVAMDKATWSAWVDFTGTSNGYHALDIKAAQPDGNLWLGINTESYGLWLYRNGAYNRASSGSLTGWHHVALTFNAGVTRWYLDGTAIGSNVDMSAKGTTWPSGNRTIGDSYTGSSWSGTPFLGTVSDFRFYATVLSAADIKSLYNTPIKVSNTGCLHVDGCVKEKSVSSALLKKTGECAFNGISEKAFCAYDLNVVSEHDGSAWLRICHHNNPSSNMFPSYSADYLDIWVNENCWRYFSAIDCVDKWEFVICQKSTTTSSLIKYRWSQPYSPQSSSYYDVMPESISKVTSGGFSGFSFGGLYKHTSNTYFAMNDNNSASDWWGAVGAWTVYNGGIPGWNKIVVTSGYMDLYLRIDNVNWNDNREKLFSIYKLSKSIRLNGVVER